MLETLLFIDVTSTDVTVSHLPPSCMTSIRSRWLDSRHMFQTTQSVLCCQLNILSGQLPGRDRKILVSTSFNWGRPADSRFMDVVPSRFWSQVHNRASQHGPLMNTRRSCRYLSCSNGCRDHFVIYCNRRNSDYFIPMTTVMSRHLITATFAATGSSGNCTIYCK